MVGKSVSLTNSPYFPISSVIPLCSVHNVAYSQLNGLTDWTEKKFCGHSLLAKGCLRIKISFFQGQRRAFQLVYNKDNKIEIYNIEIKENIGEAKTKS